MFYDNLVDACARNKCKVTPVVLECGGAKGSIANWKKGSAPNSDIVVKLAVRLNVTTDFLLRGIQNDTAFLSDDQKQLLMYYNSVDELARARISERAETLAEQQAEERAREQAKRQEIQRSVPEESAPCESIEIPFFELPVSAGLGVDLLAQDGAQETISVPATPTTRRADFSVLVEGDSMEPMFSDGDIVLVEQEQEVPEGQVGIFAVNGAGYIKKAGRRCLISANDKYDDIPISPDDSVRCFGLVIGKL